MVNNPAILLLLTKPHLQGRQALITYIIEAISQLLEIGAKVSLQPLMEEDYEGLTQVYSLACEATEEDSKISPLS